MIRAILRARLHRVFFRQTRHADLRGRIATNAFDFLIGRLSAVRAKRVLDRRLKLLVDGHAVIEHKTFAFEVLLRLLLEVVQDAAVELVDVFEA